MRRIALTVLALTLGLSAMAGCGGSDAIAEDGAEAPTGPPVVVVGDSLMDGAVIYGNLQKKVRAAGHEFVSDTQTGLRTAEGVDRIPAAIKGLEPGILVIGLGTNDTEDQAAYAAEIDRAVAAAPGWRIEWVAPHHEPVAALNTVLAEATQRHPNLTVLDFAPVLTEHPEYRSDDGVHLTPAGYEARADLVVESLATLGS